MKHPRCTYIYIYIYGSALAPYAVSDRLMWYGVCPPGDWVYLQTFNVLVLALIYRVTKMMDGLVRCTMCLAHGSAFMQLVCLNSIVY